MVKIRQHGGSGKLFDLKDFIVDLDPWQRRVSHWTIRIDECTGPHSLALAELTSTKAQCVSHLAFADLCYSMLQTIDGEFIAYLDGKEVLRLLAVDSSYWEITGPLDFEKQMVDKYGAYES